jgi:hypothetical protein
MLVGGPGGQKVHPVAHVGISDRKAEQIAIKDQRPIHIFNEDPYVSQ